MRTAGPVRRDPSWLGWKDALAYANHSLEQTRDSTGFAQGW
jgi:hypothetical protein